MTNERLSPGELERRLLNDGQAEVPLVAEPFAAIGNTLGIGHGATMSAFAHLIALGTISRIGAVFPPGVVGVSTLAAMQVPDYDLDRVAEIVSAQREVNHNYEREHRLNLWFVATARDEAHLAATLESIAIRTGHDVLSLPLVREHRIDLGFDLHGGHATPARVTSAPRASPEALRGDGWTRGERLLADALARGLPVTPRPYARLAALTGLDEAIVLARIAAWVDDGTIKRFGVVVRHRALGWRANAMCVWDVPADVVDRIGDELARERAVTLCYQRRPDPRWPYNLYCMIHGRVRADVEREITAITARHGLSDYPHAVLFSRRAFKQRGAQYGFAAQAEPA
jgi:DNA-binding Lrp family transcriptional regulator